MHLYKGYKSFMHLECTVSYKECENFLYSTPPYKEEKVRKDTYFRCSNCMCKKKYL